MPWRGRRRRCPASSAMAASRHCCCTGHAQHTGGATGRIPWRSGPKNSSSGIPWHAADSHQDMCSMVVAGRGKRWIDGSPRFPCHLKAAAPARIMPSPPRTGRTAAPTVPRPLGPSAPPGVDQGIQLPVQLRQAVGHVGGLHARRRRPGSRFHAFLRLRRDPLPQGGGVVRGCWHPV